MNIATRGLLVTNLLAAMLVATSAYSDSEWKPAVSAPEQRAIVPVAAEEARVATPHAMRPIGSIVAEAPLPLGQLPRDYAQEHGVAASPVGAVAQRDWPMTARPWIAAAMKHRPLYFEETNAERYGYTCSYCLQPVISTAHFFGTIPYLPYLMAADCPRRCYYTLGHYRPGSCAPYRKHGWPVSAIGGGAEAVAAVGLVAIIP